MKPTADRQPVSPVEHETEDPQSSSEQVIKPEPGSSLRTEPSPPRPLFPEPTEPRLGPLGYVESPVNWFTSSTRPEAAASRSVVNAWYERFPDEAGGFAKRLTSHIATEHYGALDELYVHDRLRDRHVDVRYEVGGKGPDFRIFEQDRCIAAVEVVSLFEAAQWTAPQVQYGRIADRLNRAIRPSAGYFVDLKIVRASRDPSPPLLEQFVRSQLELLPPHDELVDQLTLQELEVYRLQSTYREDDGIQIELTFRSMKPNARSRTNPDARITGMGPLLFGYSTTSQRLRARVKAKAGGRYDVSGIPFAVGVGFHEPFCDEDDLLEACYGGEVFNARTGVLKRGTEGLFGTDDHRRNGRLSAVIVIKALPLWHDPIDNILLLPNPYADQPWPTDALPARILAPHGR